MLAPASPPVQRKEEKDTWQSADSGLDPLHSFSAGGPPPRSPQQIQAKQITTLGQRLLQKADDPVKEAGGASADFTGSGYKEINELGIVYQEGGYGKGGAFLRDRPLPGNMGSHILKWLPQNTKVYILKHDPVNRWFAVTVMNGSGQGLFGYIYDALVWRHLPEPNVEVYKVKKGEYPLGIAATKYAGHFNAWGQDKRYVVNALVYVNTNARHNGTGEPGLRKPDNRVNMSWFSAKAEADTYIWLPSVSFLKGLFEEVRKKGGGSGSITYELWEGVKTVLKAIAWGGSFLAGILHGALASLWDNVVGIVKMVKDLVVSIVTGSIFSDAKKIWDAITNLTWEDIEKFFDDWVKKWKPKLFSSNPFVSGHAWGYLTGYAVMEILLMFFTGGTLAALKGAKWAGKFAEIIKGLGAVTKMQGKVNKLRQAGGKTKELIEKAASGFKKSSTGQRVTRAVELILPDGRKISVVGGKLKICASPCDLVRKKYKYVLDQNPDLTKRLDALEELAKTDAAASMRGMQQLEYDLIHKELQAIGMKGVSRDVVAHGGYNVRKQYRKMIADATHSKHGNKHLKATSDAQAKTFSTGGEAQYIPSAKSQLVAMEKKAMLDGRLYSKPGGVFYRFYKFENAVGFDNGTLTRWIRAEYSSGTIHSHPISPARLKSQYGFTE